MGTGTREGTKKSVGADRATSAAVVRFLQISHDDLMHLEHGIHPPVWIRPGPGRPSAIAFCVTAPPSEQRSHP